MTISKTKSKEVEKKKADRAIEREKKLMKSFRSLKNIVALGVFANVLVDIYILFLVFLSKGNLLNIITFALSVIFTGGLFYSSRLLSMESQNALVVYIVTVCGVWLWVFIFRFINHLPLFAGKDIFSFIFPVAILYEMHRLKKEGVLI